MPTKKLIVMCGCPASGKSTWAEREARFLENEGYTTAIISRDNIRKALVGETPVDYFAKEKEVFAEYIRQINESLEIGIDYVIADATHLNKKSRAYFLSKVICDSSTKLEFMVLRIPLEICFERNERRSGFTYVKKGQLRRMYYSFEKPTKEEFINNTYGFASIEYTMRELKEEEESDILYK